MKRAAALVAALVGAALAGCGPSYVGGARPIDPAKLDEEPGWLVARATPALRQQRTDDCGPAALAMVAAHWHVPLTVDEAVDLLPPPGPRGSRLEDLRDLARRRGLIAFSLAGEANDLVHELRAGRPVIVGLLLPYSGHKAISHYEVVVAVSDASHEVVTIDPSVAGWRRRTWQALDAEWAPVGRPALVVLGTVAGGHAAAGAHVAPAATPVAPSPP